MTRSTDGRNNSTVTTFNAWNLPTATIEPSTTQDPNPGQRTFTTSYDRGGLPVQSVEPGNVQTVRSFDAWNQLTTENATQPVPQGPGVQKQYGYDASGRLARVSSPSGDSTYTYDDRGLLVAAAGVGGTASIAYNERGLPTTRTDSSGTASFSWQPSRDQLATVTDSTGGTRSYTWNSFGQLSAESYGTALRQYGYDTAGRLSTDSLKDAGGASLSGFAYSYDVSGNVASKTVNLPGNSQSGIHMYEYDLAERLTKWTINGAATPYQYDAAGNRTQAGTATYTYDARNRLQTGPNETYSYSSRGALRQSTKNGVATMFTVDAVGRTAQSVVAGQAAVNFQYDGLDRVLNRNGAAFTYTATAMDPTSDGTTTFSRGPDGTPLWLTKAGATVAAGMDRHGDLAFTLNANLTVGSTSVYDPFGVPTVKTGPGTAIGFQADWTEPLTGNVWMGARWYTPGNASFTTRDTYAGNPATPVSLNRYTYGSNNPIRFWDPTGRAACGDEYCEDWTLDISNAAASEIWLYRAAGGVSDAGGEWSMDKAQTWVQYFYGDSAAKETANIASSYAHATDTFDTAWVTAHNADALSMGALHPAEIAAVAIALKTPPSEILGEKPTPKNHDWFFANPSNYVFTRDWQGMYNPVGWGKPNQDGELFNSAGTGVRIGRSGDPTNSAPILETTALRVNSLSAVVDCIQSTHGVCHTIDGGTPQYNAAFDTWVARAGYKHNANAQSRISSSDSLYKALLATGMTAAEGPNSRKVEGAATKARPCASFRADTFVR
jgi:RHS repeat-associated protein